MPSAAPGQGYPIRPITLVVTFPPGGAADIIARTLEPVVSADLGQSVVIENRPGVGGNIGIGAVAKAVPDGYTLGIAPGGVLAVAPHLGRAMPFDPEKDLTPITMLVETPFLLVASRDGPKSVAEVIGVAGANPEKLSIGHGGNGTSMHLTAALFIQKAAVRMPLVAYRGTAPATNDLLGGHIPLAILDIPGSLPLIQEGKLKALAISSAKRVPFLPNVPTFAEAGVKDCEAVGWLGLVAAAGTPQEIVIKLNATFTKAMKDPAITNKLRTLGAEPAPSTPEAFRQFINSERAKWAKVVAEAGVKPE